MRGKAASDNTHRDSSRRDPIYTKRKINLYQDLDVAQLSTKNQSTKRITKFQCIGLIGLILEWNSLDAGYQLVWMSDHQKTRTSLVPPHFETGLEDHVV